MGREGRTEVKGLFSQQQEVTCAEPLSVSRNDLKKVRDSKVTMFAASSELFRAEETRAGCEELPGPSHQAVGQLGSQGNSMLAKAEQTHRNKS